MNGKAQELAERLKKFNDEVVGFVEKCSDADLSKMCSEDWPVGVTARHIGASHYGVAVAMAGNIVRGEKPPELTGEQVTAMANEHARQHADCTREEVLDVLRKGGREMIEFVSGLDDADLERSAYMTLMGAEITARKFIEVAVLRSGGEHLGSMKAAIGK